MNRDGRTRRNLSTGVAGADSSWLELLKQHHWGCPCVWGAACAARFATGRVCALTEGVCSC